MGTRSRTSRALLLVTMCGVACADAGAPTGPEDPAAGVEPPASLPTVPRMLPPMPAPQSMPPPADTSDVMKHRFLCATYGVCPSTPTDAPKIESTAPLLSPLMPKPSSRPDQAAQGSEAEKRP